MKKDNAVALGILCLVLAAPQVLCVSLCLQPGNSTLFLDFSLDNMVSSL